mmetsp:Transcript_121368/g.343870  ORF Transcript_121368/g.343870 Transcript_121368/m.343870 type:complete len:234 (+) Transcript_121368:371-1072(+)
MRDVRADGVDITSFAWALSKLRLHDGTLLDAISAQSLPTLSQLLPQALSNLAWADSRLRRWDTPLLAALAAEAIRRLRLFPAQYLVGIADLHLPCAAVLQGAAAAMIDAAFGEDLGLLDGWRRLGAPPLLRRDPVNSLGYVGTHLVFRRMGVAAAPAAFCHEAGLRIAAAHAQVREAEASPQDGDLLAEKTWSFAGYDFLIGGSRSGHHAGDARHVCGTVLKDNGFKHARPSM